MPVAIFVPDHVGKDESSAADIVGGDSAVSDDSDATYIHTSSDGSFVLNDGWVTFPGGGLSVLGTAGVDYTINSIKLGIRWMETGPTPLSLSPTFENYARTVSLSGIGLSGGNYAAPASTTAYQERTFTGPILDYLNGPGFAIRLNGASGTGAYDAWWYECKIVVDYNGPELPGQEPPPIAGCYAPDYVDAPPVPTTSAPRPYPATIVGSGNVLADYSDSTYAELGSFNDPFAGDRYGTVWAHYDGFPADGAGTFQMRLKLLDYTYTNRIVVQGLYMDTFGPAGIWDFYIKGSVEPISEGVTTWATSSPVTFTFTGGRPIRFQITAYPTGDVGPDLRPLVDLYEFQVCFATVPTGTVHAPVLRVFPRSDGRGASSAQRVWPRPPTGTYGRVGPGSLV